MPNVGNVGVRLFLNDKLTSGLTKAGASVKKFSNLTDKQMRRVEKASEKLDKFGKSATKMGRSMSMKMTLPMVGAGAAAFKLAKDFESSMTKIESLVGKSAEEVEGLTKSVLSLAGTTARAPQELADAMFFITSAGIDAADAAGVLEASAKAAAVGLGDTATIADLATSAMNAYGKENLSASNATDVMVSAVREGKLEASELAGSMGRVLPIASAMGVSFNEVGAAFASLSRTGTNAAEAATQVRGIMTSLLRPTKMAEEALTEMGLSSEGLRTQIKEQGLLSTLKTLADEFDGNAAASASVFGNVRALSGVMDLMGKNVAGTEKIFASMNDTLGATDKAFAVTSDTAEFKLSQAISDFKVAMIAVGQEIIPVVLPIIQKLAEFIGKIVKAFSNLSGPMKTVIVIVALMVAALGPLLVIAGMVATAITSIGAATVLAFLGPIGLAIAAIGLLTFAFMKLTSVDKEAQARQEALSAEFKAAGDPLQNLTTKTEALVSEYETLKGAIEEVTPEVARFAGENVLLAELMDRDVGTAFKNLGLDAKRVEFAVKGGTDEFQRMAGQAKQTGATQESLAKKLRTVKGEAQHVTAAIADKLDQDKLSLDEAHKMLIALDETADAYDDNRKEVNKTSKAYFENSEEMTRAANILGVDVVESAKAAAKATGKYGEAQHKLNQEIEEAVKALRTVRGGFEAADAAMVGMTGSIDEATAAAAAQVEEIEKVAKTWEELVEVADKKALYFKLELDTTGLYEQLNDAMNAIVDLGSMMPGGDSAMLDEQLAISRRISAELVGTKEADAAASVAANKAANAAAKAAAKAAQAAHDAAVAEAQKAFDSFVSTTIGMGGAAISESFAKAIVGSPEDIKQAFNQLFNTAFDSGLTQIPELRTVFLKALEGQELLIEIANKRVELTQTLETAEERLTQALENQAKAQGKVNQLAKDRASLAATTASAFGFKFGEDIGAKAQADLLLAQYTSFEGNLKSLQTKGFPTDIISQVIGLGAFAGNDAAEGLLAMGETDFAAFTTALTGISAMGAKIGDIEAGMKFGGLQSAAEASLLGATAGAEGEKAARDAAKLSLSAQNVLAKETALALQKAFGGDIEAFVKTLGPLSEQQAHELAIFSATLQELTTGVGRGINDVLNNEALGKIPELLAAKAFNAAVIPLGTKADPIVVTDPKVEEILKQTVAHEKALAFNQRTAVAQSVNQAVTQMAGGAGFAEADAASLGIASTLRNRVTSNMAYQAADASMLDSYIPKAGVTQNYFDINIAGSVIGERDLGETMRQISLSDQRSGKAWAVGVL